MVKTLKSLTEMLKPVKDALLSVSENVGRHFPIDGTKSHIVYYEDSEASEVAGDNKKILQAIQGSIDLYVKPEDISMFDDVQDALAGEGISFRLNSTQINETGVNGFIHFEWIFEVS